MDLRDFEIKEYKDGFVLLERGRAIGEFQYYGQARQYLEHYQSRFFAQDRFESESERRSRLLREKSVRRNSKIDQILG